MLFTQNIYRVRILQEILCANKKNKIFIFLLHKMQVNIRPGEHSSAVFAN